MNEQKTMIFDKNHASLLCVYYRVFAWSRGSPVVRHMSGNSIDLGSNLGKYIYSYIIACWAHYTQAKAIN